MASLISLWLTCAAVMADSIPSLEAQLRKNPRAMTVRMALATEQARAKQFAKTVELLNPYTDQLNDEGFLLLASSYSGQANFEEEVRVLGILSERQDENFRWHMLLGQAYLKNADKYPEGDKNKAQLTAAIQQLRRAIQLNKKFKPSFDLLLNTLLEQKMNSEARELLVEAVDRFGERPEYLREECRLDALDGYLPQAVKNCRRGIELSPTYPDTYVYLVQALHDEGEDNTAEQDIVAAARRFPQSEFVQWAAGTVFWRKKNFPVAARYFEAGVRANPREGRSQFGLAQSLYEAHREKDALPRFIEACKLDAKTVETFLASGSKLKQNGNPALGAAYLKAADTCR